MKLENFILSVAVATVSGLAVYLLTRKYEESTRITTVAGIRG